MRTLAAIFLLTIMFSCSDRKSEKDINHKNKPSGKFEISVIDGKLPLRLNELNFEDHNNYVHLNDGINSKIEETVKVYAKDFEYFDSTQTYKDIYINTVRLHDSLQTIYLVLLKHYPTGEVNSRVLFYDNQQKEFANSVFDFNLFGLYHHNNGKLTSTNLKTDFEITTPEIEVVDFNKDGINDFKFVRLWHNGTFNAIHTTILTVSDNKIDTLYFNERPIVNEEILKE
ncbi:hypothetical protein [Fulvivirga ligni]|uniref:hypothetical protein n=1 Tax=Fulvivirga ligni TaxID=2904246 RepID=UPI001F3F8A95|nr:hypothetical protein [Fulvivirga ligni]UII19613.1 hypothetical protein LVD16_17375 [Fulvivirga ligni]